MEFLNSKHHVLMFRLPAGWSTGYCIITKKYYYINNFTHKTQWNRPIAPAPHSYPDIIKCNRILIRHRDSERESWRPYYIMRTKREAAHLIYTCFVLLKSEELTFAEVSYKYSDSEFARQGGDVQWINRSSAIPEITNSIFNLSVGEISLPIETPAGFEIYLRLV